VTPAAKPNVDLLQGTLDVLILKTVSWGPMHGYAIARYIQQVTEDVLQIEEGSLYPSLHRMEKRGWIEAEWGLSENNRRAKYYKLTSAGRQQLRSESTNWAAFAGAVAKVLTSAQQPSGVRA
jgi:PadR family transcriptional regulator, regulatory protein PadR